jgi:hypothetical protein
MPNVSTKCAADPAAPWLAILAGLVLFFNGCATFQARQKYSSLPIETRHASFGKIKAEAWETQEHLYVSGSVRRVFGGHYPHNAAVEIDVLDGKGRVLRTERDRVPASSPSSPGDNRWESFVVSFLLDDIQGASGVRISLVGGAK